MLHGWLKEIVSSGARRTLTVLDAVGLANNPGLDHERKSCFP
jgi:hypothetical protein